MFRDSSGVLRRSARAPAERSSAQASRQAVGTAARASDAGTRSDDEMDRVVGAAWLPAPDAAKAALRAAEHTTAAFEQSPCCLEGRSGIAPNRSPYARVGTIAEVMSYGGARRILSEVETVGEAGWVLTGARRGRCMGSVLKWCIGAGSR